MLELEPCSICGKQVLISRYPWSENQTRCRICSEMDIDSSTGERDPSKFQQDESIDAQFALGKKRVISQMRVEKKPIKDPEEILVTWPSLFRISLGILFIGLLILVGKISLQNGRQNSPYEKGPSSLIN